jgi:hypothetical protein
MPKPIGSDAENERYTAALLELESRSRLTAEEKYFAEILAHLIETYEEKRYPTCAKKIWLPCFASIKVVRISMGGAERIVRLRKRSFRSPARQTPPQQTSPREPQPTLQSFPRSLRRTLILCLNSFIFSFTI